VITVGKVMTPSTSVVLPVTGAGAAVTAATQSLYELYPSEIHVVLEPGDPGETNDVRLRQIDRLQSQGVLTEDEAKTLRHRISETTK
jgi:hypothetical protein